MTLLIVSCNNNNNIAASVNGEYIYSSDINIVVEHFNDEKYDFKAVLNNTINELLVVQKAKKNNIFISKSEFQSYVDKFKGEVPLLYNIGVEIYGENKFISGLKVRQIYKKMKSYVSDNILEQVKVQDADIIKYISYFKNVTYEDYKGLSQLEQAEVIGKIKVFKQEELFNNWVKELRNAADIKIF